MLVVSCMNYESKRSTQRALSSAQSQRFSAASKKRNSAKSRKSAKPTGQSHKPSGKYDEDQDEEMSFSVKDKKPTQQKQQQEDDNNTDGGHSTKSYSERIQNSGGLSRKNKAVSFRSSRVALDENYMQELDAQQAEFSFSTKIRQYTEK